MDTETKQTAVAVQDSARASVEINSGSKRLPALVADSAVGLIQVALEKGVTVDAIRELVGLHEQMEKRDARKQFAAALRLFQKACGPIKHNTTATIVTGNGRDYSYTYAELDHVARTIAPMLDEFGFSYGWDSKVDQGYLTCTCTLRHDAGHSETSSLTLPIENKSGMSPQQKVGAAMSFAQRRTLSAVLGITTSDDMDGGELDNTPIDEGQAKHIDDMLKTVGANREKFLKMMDVDRIAMIPRRRYEFALDMLRRKAKEPA